MGLNEDLGDRENIGSASLVMAHTRRLLQAATRATGYLEGYDDGVNDCLRWLQVQAPTVMAGLVAAIQLNAEVSKSPIKVAEEFLSVASKPEVAQP